MPPEHIGRGWNDLWQLVGYLQLLILDEISYKLGAFVPFIEFSVRELCRSQSSAYEFPDATFVFRSKEKLAMRVIDNFELALVL